jgi:BolA protein
VALQEWMKETLNRGLAPSDLTITDESHLHAGHAGSREGGETHFRIDVVSEAFAGKSRVGRHRLVNELLAEAFGRLFTGFGLILAGALAIYLRSPRELRPS